MADAQLRLDTSRRSARWLAPLSGVLGLALLFQAARTRTDEALGLGGVGAAMLGVGLYFAFLRSGLIADRETKHVTAWWRWLLLKGGRTESAAGKRLSVEHFTSHSEDSGTTHSYRVCLEDLVLHTLSEHQGGKEAATALATQLGEHLGVPFDGHRECPKSAKRDALRAKYALMPLYAVMAALVLGALLLLLGLRK